MQDSSNSQESQAVCTKHVHDPTSPNDLSMLLEGLGKSAGLKFFKALTLEASGATTVCESGTAPVRSTSFQKLRGSSYKGLPACAVETFDCRMRLGS